MALSFPYTKAFLADCLIGERVPLALQRNDERSGSGDGRFWSAELAPPLWTASYALYAKSAAHAREINAKVYGLDGMAKEMLWSDPNYHGPASGSAGLGAVQILGISADRGGISLSGLPPDFVITAGDYLSINHGTKVYFGTFVEGGTAGVGGNLAVLAIRPYLPLTINVNAAVELANVRFKAIVTDYQPFASTRWKWGDSASISILQRP